MIAKIQRLGVSPKLILIPETVQDASSLDEWFNWNKREGDMVPLKEVYMLTPPSPGQTYNSSKEK